MAAATRRPDARRVGPSPELDRRNLRLAVCSGRLPRALRARSPSGSRLLCGGSSSRSWSPGSGIALAVKDLFDTEGVRTTYGSAVFAEHVPTRSAEAVRLLEAAGYANIGKTNLHEFAYGITSQNLHYGTVPNPAAPGRTSGGSSGGSAAALVLGLADAALGTDTGGSIRIPAACCGIVGFKPTYGLVSTDGVFPLAPELRPRGPMARDVAGCDRMMEVLAPGFTAQPSRSRRADVATSWFEQADPLVRGPGRGSGGTLPRYRRRLSGRVRHDPDLHARGR